MLQRSEVETPQREARIIDSSATTTSVDEAARQTTPTPVAIVADNGQAQDDPGCG
jgi:hypothetical protein